MQGETGPGCPPPPPPPVPPPSSPERTPSTITVLAWGITALLLEVCLGSRAYRCRSFELYSEAFPVNPGIRIWYLIGGRVAVSQILICRCLGQTMIMHQNQAMFISYLPIVFQVQRLQGNSPNATQRNPRTRFPDSTLFHPAPPRSRPPPCAASDREATKPLEHAAPLLVAPLTVVCCLVTKTKL